MSSLLNSHCIVCNEDITSSKSFVVTTVLDPNSLLQHTFYNFLESISSFMQVDITKVSQNACEKCYEAGLQARQFQSLCNRTAEALIDTSRENMKEEYRCADGFNSDSLSDDGDFNSDGDAGDNDIPVESKETCLEETSQSKPIKTETVQSQQIKVECAEEEMDIVTVNTVEEEEEESASSDSDNDNFNQETRSLLGPSAEEIGRQKERERHNRFGKEKVKCKICLKIFSRSYITIHYRSHTGERPYKCELCPKAFKDATSYRNHEMTHNGIRPFLCTVCGVGFRTKTRLTYHASVHNGETPYSCEVCGKQFRTSKRLSIHLTVHSDLKPFACEQCPKTFRIKNLLKQHMVTHAAIKPVECTFCGKRFSQKHVLRSHQAKSCPGLKRTNE